MVSQSWDKEILIETWFLESVEQWLIPNWFELVVSLLCLPSQERLYTDASQTGWGAHVDSLSAAGVWSPEQGLWHSNMREMEAVFLAIQEFVNFLTWKSGMLCTNNTLVAVT